MLVYLHGGSLRGNDVERIRTLGLPRRLETDTSFPFIVISPLCPPGEIWTDIETVNGIVDDVLRSHNGDPRRVYVTGHSMGGRGALYFAFRHPERFAAVVAMSAVSPISDWAPRLAKTPIWYVHGAKDRDAPIAEADDLMGTVRAAGGDVQYARLDDGDHFLLDRYDGRDWQEWLLTHRR